jgi:hypothetical protein
MSIGPLVCCCGLILITRLSPHASYARDVVPAVAVFALGLAIFVAPLPATVLGATAASHAGVASGVNNAVARAAGLIAIAAIPVIAGLTGDTYTDRSGSSRISGSDLDLCWPTRRRQRPGGADHPQHWRRVGT